MPRLIDKIRIPAVQGIGLPAGVNGDEVRISGQHLFEDFIHIGSGRRGFAEFKSFKYMGNVSGNSHGMIHFRLNHPAVF